MASPFQITSVDLDSIVVQVRSYKQLKDELRQAIAQQLMTATPELNDQQISELTHLYFQEFFRTPDFQQLVIRHKKHVRCIRQTIRNISKVKTVGQKQSRKMNAACFDTDMST